MTRKIALTGGIACGKSLAGDYLQKLGIPVIDADHVVHQLLKEDLTLKRQIQEEFGPAIFNAAGEIDRVQLGKAVFGNLDKRKLLESWIHPKTREQIEAFYRRHSEDPKVVAIIPLLFESGIEKYYDEVWLLETEPDMQLDRLLNHRGMSREDAQARILSQMPSDIKRQRAELHGCYCIINNSSTPDMLYAEILKCLER